MVEKASRTVEVRVGDWPLKSEEAEVEAHG
jgi:hypothetical protein